MSEERIRTKSELKSLVAANLKRKGWTDDMASILIDVLWRDKFTMRTSGFYYPGGTDAIIAFDNATRIFSISPLDPMVEDFIPRFGFYSWSHRAVYHRRYETEEIQLPDEEGLFAIYYAVDETTRSQSLHFLKNPTEDEKKDFYIKKTLVSFIYWDYDMQTVLHFGDDRHGSEWQPQMHYYLHQTLKAQVHSGLTITDMLINQDGSLDSHARFTVNSGKMWHDDFILDIQTAGGLNTIPVLYFLGAGNSFPRFTETSGFGVYKSANRICYNNTATEITEATSDFHVMYHVFSVNEHVSAARKVVTAMGTNEYETLPEAYTNVIPELDGIYKLMPQQGVCYLGTVVFQTSDGYTNSVKARIVAFFEKDASHPPVAIALDSVDFLDITEAQVLSWKGERPITITQAAHGFVVGKPIRHNETIWVGAQANNAENAQTMGIVTKVIDADNFQYKSGGFLLDAQFEDGKEYFLSPTSSAIMELPFPEVWSVGEVRQSLGWGTPEGLKIEIDVGDEIVESSFDSNLVTSLVIANEKLTLSQSGGDNVFVPFPYYTKTELNTSGAGGQVHWDNIVGAPWYDNYVSWKVYFDGSYGNIVRSGAIVDFVPGAGLDLAYAYNNPNQTLTFSHSNTSNQANSVNTGTSVIQSVELDDFGHVTALATKTISEYQYWWLTANSSGETAMSSGNVLDLIDGNDISIGVALNGARKEVTIAYTGDGGVTDHGELDADSLLDYDHPQYAKLNGVLSESFQVKDLSFAALNGWSLKVNTETSVLEFWYGDDMKFEFKTDGEAFGTDFIAY
jgi:hypothetical protein